ncbi:unnamed protein product [Rotaria socialis]|uniref:Anaphase-promoting complex subunit 7 n=2 Tax=Rotaria socialis TaxID=392032 RepID=A0A821L0E4_9BILA|nr:unnamed protein product [Rotaria socialis]CAF4743562.1 unnamed protein product [Rotaria socialis]
MTLKSNCNIISDDENCRDSFLSDCDFDLSSQSKNPKERRTISALNHLSINQNEPQTRRSKTNTFEKQMFIPQIVQKEQHQSPSREGIDSYIGMTKLLTNSTLCSKKDLADNHYQDLPFDGINKLTDWFQNCTLNENKFSKSCFWSNHKTNNQDVYSIDSPLSNVSCNSNPFLKSHSPSLLVQSSSTKTFFDQDKLWSRFHFTSATIGHDLSIEHLNSASSDLFCTPTKQCSGQSSMLSFSPLQVVPYSLKKPTPLTKQESSSPLLTQCQFTESEISNKKEEITVRQQSSSKIFFTLIIFAIGLVLGYLLKKSFSPYLILTWIYNIMASIEQLETLRNAELHDDCKTLAEFILTLDECGKEYLNNEQRLIVYRCLADSTWFLHEYHLAESYFKKVLHSYKQLDKYDKNALEPDWTIESKYRQHLCLIKLNRLKEALTVLESVSFQQRTAKIHLALGQCYQKAGGSIQESISAYRECLKQNPNTLSAYIALLALGIKLSDLLHTHPSAASIHHENQAQQPTPVTISPLVRQPWFRALLQADACSTSRDFAESSRLYQQIDAQYLPQSTYVLCQLGYNQYLNGDYGQALHSLQRAQQIDPLLLKHMDILAFLTYTECKDNSFEKFVNHLMSLGDNHPETWIAIGYYCLKKNHKPSRTVYLAQKAYALDNTRIQALLLKGLALFKLKRYSDSLVHYKEAVRLTPYCFEGYKGVVDGYLATNRLSDANMFITNAVRTNLKENARAFTLCGQVLAKEPSSLDKARVYLEKALALNPKYTEAVISLVEVYGQLKQQQKSIELLKEHVQINNDQRIRQLLIENLMKSGSNEEMLQQVRNYPGTTHFERLEREMNDDSSFDGGRFDTGAMGDLDPMCDDVIGENFSDEDL